MGARLELRYTDRAFSPDLFLSSESQYLANSSGDLEEALGPRVTALLFTNLPHACRIKEQLVRNEQRTDGIKLYTSVLYYVLY